MKSNEWRAFHHLNIYLFQHLLVFQMNTGSVNKKKKKIRVNQYVYQKQDKLFLQSMLGQNKNSLREHLYSQCP